MHCYVWAGEMNLVKVAVVQCLVLFLLCSKLHGIGIGSCENGDIRLVGGSTYLEGRVEVCFREEWGTVCDDDWDEPDANVACAQLGYSNQGAVVFDGPFAVYHRSPFGIGSGNIIFEELQCTGNESSLFQCLRSSSCVHGEDVGVRCQNNILSLVHDGQLIQNNSLLSLETLNNNSLSCVTNNPVCCNTNRSGNWFPPGDDAPVMSTSPTSTTLYQSWGDDQSIQLLLPDADIVDSGLYRCEVPDRNGITQMLYVGIYSSTEEGSIEEVDATYDNSSQTMICTSRGGPASSVTWTLDGSVIDIDSSTSYRASQIVTNTTTATYQNKLTIVAKSASLSGNYTCSVGNAGVIASASVIVSVCRNNEVVIQRDTSTLMICHNDQWLPQINSLQFQSNNFPIRNIQLDFNEDRILLAWEPPLTEEEILSYNIVCSSSNFPQVMLSLAVRNGETLAEIPMLSTASQASYRCCVSAVVRVSSGVHFLTETCSSITPMSGQPTITVISHSTFSILDGGLVAVAVVSLLVVGILIAVITSILLLNRKNTRKECIRTASNDAHGLTNPISMATNEAYGTGQQENRQTAHETEECTYEQVN